MLQDMLTELIAWLSGVLGPVVKLGVGLGIVFLVLAIWIVVRNVRVMRRSKQALVGRSIDD